MLSRFRPLLRSPVSNLPSLLLRPPSRSFVSRSRPNCKAAAEEAAAESESTAPATFSQLKALFIYSAVPMVGFGLMDNFIMITAGDYIDNTFGVVMGISTLTAAAFGQGFSDVSGVLFGGAVERFFTKLGLKSPNLSAAQRATSKCKNVVIAGSVVGVFVGCMMGASTLMFIDWEAAEQKEKLKQLDDVLTTVMSHGDDMIEAERCAVFFVDEKKRELWSKYASEDLSKGGTVVTNATVKTTVSQTEKVITVPIDASLVGLCYLSNKTTNIKDVTKTKEFNAAVAAKQEFKVKSILCAPIRNDEGKVVAVAEFLNKRKGEKGEERFFDKNDEKLAEMLAHHVSIFIKRLEKEDD